MFNIAINTIAPRIDVKNPGHEILVVVNVVNPDVAHPAKNEPIIPTIISPNKPLLSFKTNPAIAPVIAPNKIHITKFSIV